MSTADATRRVLIVSNRLPVSARWRTGRLQIVASTGGLATGLAPLRRREHLVWIGWSGATSPPSDEDREHIARRFQDEGLVPVHLAPEDVALYYDGFSNGVVWPLFHHLLDRVPLDSTGWDAYRRVNEQFAAAVAAQWRPGDCIWVHDYHLMLVPKLLRALLPDARIGFFRDIPFPAPNIYRTLPWRSALLEGLLGADVIGFHTQSYVDHFLAAARGLAAVEQSPAGLAWRCRTLHVAPFPLGIDEQRFAAVANERSVVVRAAAIRAEAHDRKILLGIDRLDYTKGIPRRLVAFERLLKRHPSRVDHVRFIQIAAPSRVDVRAYKVFRRELDELVSRINGRFGTVDSVPIHYLRQSLSQQEVAALYRAADVMVVTPLRDGMNLVAQEFVGTRTDEDGMLVLSELAGAAERLDGALLVNPCDVDGVADTIAHALSLAPIERRRRMHLLRSRVSAYTVYDWCRDFVARLGDTLPARAVRAATTDDPCKALSDGRLSLTGPIIVLVDYDGTLVPIADTPELATPDTELLQLVARLAVQPDLDLHLVSGRAISNVQQWFWHVPATLWAEHGAARRKPSEGWVRLAGSDKRLLGIAKRVFERFCTEMTGARVEEKATSLAWHYRLVQPTPSAEQLSDVRRALGEALGDGPMEVLDGHMVLEVRPRGVSKAVVARHLATTRLHRGSVIAIGDDETDEQLFKALPPDAITIRVGGGSSVARYRLPDAFAVRAFLSRLLVPCPSVSPTVRPPLTALGDCASTTSTQADQKFSAQTRVSGDASPRDTALGVTHVRPTFLE